MFAIEKPALAGSPGDSTTLEHLHRVPKRHYGRWALRLLLAALVAMLIDSILMNDRFQWNVVQQYLFEPSILKGLVTSLELTGIAMACGIVLGTVLAVLSQSPDRWARGCSGAFIWFFRGTPLMVQLIFWFNLGALYDHISLGVPFGPPIFSLPSNSITPMMAAILGLGLNEGAYMAEIVRGGLLAVSKGQGEAALALGMRRGQTLRRIVLPQAMRVIVPATGNQVIGMLKTTSIVSVIALPELLYSVQTIYSRTFQTIPLLLVACLWYLALTTVLTLGQSQLERRLGRGYAPTQRAGDGGRSSRRPLPDDATTVGDLK